LSGAVPGTLDYLRAPEWLRRTTTNGQGEYQIGGLGDEAVWILARDPSGARADVWYPDTPLVSSARQIAAPLGATLALPDLVMELPAAAVAISTEVAGEVRNGVTNAPIANAVISLHWLPGWRERLDSRDIQAQTCPSADSTGLQTPTGEAANASTGLKAFAGLGMFTPDSHQILSDGNGRFGWRLTPGCWYLHASAPGFQDAYSPVWGVVGIEDNAPPWIVALEPLPTTPTPVTPATATPDFPTATTPSASPSASVSPSVTQTPGTTPTTATPKPGTSTHVPPATATPVPSAVPSASKTPAVNASPAMPTPDAPTATGTTPPPVATKTPTKVAETPVPPVAVFVYGILFGDENGNRVQEEAEKGLAGVTLALVRTGGLTGTLNTAAGTGDWRQTTMTSDMGGFAFRNVPPGRYMLSFAPPEGIVLRSPNTLSLVIDGSSDRLSMPLGVSAAGAFVLLPLVIR
jgi:hypothetical protein